jgi:hypothetical protein
MMKSILTTIAFLALAVSGLAQTRSVIVNTSGVVQSPTNFWSADVTNARSGLGLGTAATNPASAFQPSSLALSNLASSNGGALTNLTAANITGIVSISNGGSSATTVGGARTNLGLGTTNLVQFAGVVSPNLYSSSLNALIELDDNAFILTADTAEFRQPISFDNTTNAATTRTNLGLGATNDVEFQTVKINLSTGVGDSLIVTNSGGSATSLFDDITVNELDAETAAFGNTVIVSSNGISFNTNTAAATTRTNLGGTTVGNSVFTATNAAAAATAVGLGTTNDVTFGSVRSSGLFVSIGTNEYFYAADDMVEVSVPMTIYGTYGISFATNVAAAQTRTNLGLGWSALTNSNAGTGLVSVSTNGEVVSPTNFWQVAPIVTRFVESQPVVSQTTNITAARNLHIHSLAISTTGVTNTISLPTTNSFDGDVALVVHQGPTSSVTAVRTAGASTNLITLNQFEEAVEFVYYNNVWQFNHNLSYIEPIFFSGTNAAANAAASRTNLGIGSGATNTVSFGKIRVPAGGLTIEDPANDASIITFPTDTDPVVLGADYWDHAAVRTSLGLGSGITTNLVLKNSANQDTYLNFSNGILKYGSTTPP